MNQVMSRRTGPLQRVAAADFSTAEEVLKSAALLIVPDDQTQRQAVDKLMPHLYVLRNKGCSWAQLAKLLGECGINLQPSTVRIYYTEMLATRMDICQQRMNEQIALMAAVRSETAGMDLASMTSRVSAVMQRLQQSASRKVDSLFGPAAAPLEPPRPPARVPRPSLPPPPTFAQVDDDEGRSLDHDAAPRGRGERGPAPQMEEPPDFLAADDQLQAPGPAARRPTGRAAGAPPAPASPPASAEASSGPVSKRVAALQEGVPPLKKRDGPPAHVYQPGDLEHPAIPGLMLTLEQRLYGAALEYYDVEGSDQGEIKIETPDQKRFRVVWRQAVPPTKSRTAGTFTQMDTSLFPDKS